MVMKWSAFTCKNFVAFPYVNSLKWFFKVTYVRGSFPPNERRQMCCPHLKKVTLSASKTIVQFLFSLFVAKYLNVYFVTACSFFFGKWRNLDLDQVFLVPTSYYQLHTKFFQHLMMVTKSGIFFFNISKAFERVW